MGLQVSRYFFFVSVLLFSSIGTIDIYIIFSYIYFGWVVIILKFFI